MKFSANLGFLWTDLSLPDAIRAAAKAGFDAVECHWPYSVDPADVRAALVETGLPMLGLNTDRGDVAAGENGLCAVPGRQGDARAAIDHALSYAKDIGAGAVHVMAGVAEGDEAAQCFEDALRYALAQAGELTLLIEPLNPFDAPGYFLRDAAHARAIIDAIDDPRLRLMFDCYHVERTTGDVLGALDRHLPVIGHIQFASVPDRAAPDRGTLDYTKVFARITELGWNSPLGAEYKPGGPTDETLGWMQSLR